MTRDYKADLAEASKKLAEVLNERERLNVEVAKWQFRVAALLMLTQSEELDQEIGMTLGGLTDAVLTAFRSVHPGSLTPVEAKERLISLGFPIEHYKNPMAAVHTVISRLFDARKIAPVKNANGENAFTYRLIAVPPEGFVPMNTDGAKVNADRARRAMTRRNKAFYGEK